MRLITPWKVKRKEYANEEICSMYRHRSDDIVLMVGLFGCRKEGPAEKAGKNIDKTIEKAGEQIEKAGDKVKEAVK